VLPIETTLFRVALFVATLVATRLATAPLEAVSFVRLGDKVLHAGAFLVLAGLLDFSFPATRFAGGKVATLLAYGMAIEIVQHFLPYRSFSLLDWLADAGGVVLYVVVATPILKRTAWLQRRWDPQVFQ
jgi:VanZ family protein